jgi:hypothetical protein
MKLDALRKYAKLRQQLIDEKSQLEAQLKEINEVLGAEAESTPVAPAVAPREVQRRTPGRRGRKKGVENTMSMREAVLKALSKGPVARKDLVAAVEDVGYVFTTKNPLNSLGSVLYARNTPIKNKNGRFYLPGGADAANLGPEAAPAQEPGKKKRTMTPEGKARISAAQKARWAKQKGDAS